MKNRLRGLEGAQSVKVKADRQYQIDSLKAEIARFEKKMRKRKIA